MGILIEGRTQRRKDMNNLILCTFCLFGFLYGKHFLIETKNQENTNSEDYGLRGFVPKTFTKRKPKNETPQPVPCIPDNAENKAALDKMVHDAAKYLIDNDKVIKSVTGSLPQNVTKETRGKFNSVITDLMKEMKEKLKGLVVKKSNNCMALDTGTANMISFVMETDVKGEDYFFGFGFGLSVQVGFVGVMAPVVGGIFRGMFG